MRTILCTVIAALLSVTLTANPVSVKDSLLHELAQRTTAQDSIPLLYHLCDIAKAQMDQIKAYEQLRIVAHRAGDEHSELDALRQLTNICSTSDSCMNACLEQARLLPESNDRKETECFIEVDIISMQVRTATEEQKQKTLQKLINEYKEGQRTDVYEEIKRLYEVCLYLSYATTGELYIEYLDKLEELIKQLPADGRRALPSMYYTQRVILYTRHYECEKAVEADKELLRVIKEFEEEYKRKGRIFRDYTNNYYICYRRMLSNYPALKPEEVEYYYREILKMAARNADIKADIDETNRPLIYYHMARKEYAEALALMKSSMKYFEESNQRLYMAFLKEMMEAAGHVGDNAALLQATTRYNVLLEQYNRLKSAQKYKELQILYDVNQLKTENAQLELEKQDAEIASNRTVIRITLTAIVVLLLLLAVVLWLLHKTRGLVRDLKVAKENLQDERKHLLQTQEELTLARDQAESANRMKTEFIQNMSHEIRTPLNSIVGFSQIIAECIDSADKEDLYEYAKTISDNSKLLLTLVGDVLDISVMESGDVKPDLMLYSVDSVCKLALRNVKDRVQPDVDLLFEPDEHTPHNLLLLTDPVRLEQLLTNYLTNAAKFTSQGKIVLSYSLDADRRYVTFSVTDTGIGIPVGKAEIIFERFEKLNSFVQGSGLGLHLCRLIARMLKGEVMVDTTYTQGARFLFIHPYNV